MIKKIEAKERYLADHGWLSSYHLFSFAEYYDPLNMNFGVLRVFNDDLIAAGYGFGKHGHRDMEIVTIVQKGELTHEDTLGNRRVIKAGEVQYMSAGRGVMHSEINAGEIPVHLFQIWLQPAKIGLTPKYEQKDFSGSLRNTLIPVASGVPLGEALLIQSYATVSLCTLEDAKTISLSFPEGRDVFFYIFEGTLLINDSPFSEGDQARIVSEACLTIVAKGLTQFVMIGIEKEQ